MRLKHLLKHLNTLKNHYNTYTSWQNHLQTSVWNIRNIQIKTLATYIWKKQMKHLKQTLAAYVYSHCNICNIPIYYCNIYTKYLQHTSETSTIVKTYVCNMGERPRPIHFGRQGGRQRRVTVWAPPAPAALVGAPWLGWRRPEAPRHLRLAAIDRGSDNASW
jgi:hypothetical protein